mmetsp:Transcript_38177/g.91738  ORF Transcript_38177/g.91738 Transcript_38177/m.91738 type:complete len:235 (+) Transcript_38177:105-809(+)
MPDCSARLCCSSSVDGVATEDLAEMQIAAPWSFARQYHGQRDPAGVLSTSAVSGGHVWLVLGLVPGCRRRVQLYRNHRLFWLRVCGVVGSVGGAVVDFVFLSNFNCIKSDGELVGLLLALPNARDRYCIVGRLRPRPGPRTVLPVRGRGWDVAVHGSGGANVAGLASISSGSVEPVDDIFQASHKLCSIFACRLHSGHRSPGGFHRCLMPSWSWMVRHMGFYRMERLRQRCRTG